MTPDKPKLLSVFLRDSVNEEVESFERLFVLFHAKEANHGVVCELVHIETAKTNIRKIGLTAVLRCVVFEFGRTGKLAPRVQSFVLVHNLTALL